MKTERKAGSWLDKNVDHRGAVAGNELQDDTRLPDGINKSESSRWQLQASLPDGIDKNVRHRGGKQDIEYQDGTQLPDGIDKNVKHEGIKVSIH